MGTIYFSGLYTLTLNSHASWGTMMMSDLFSFDPILSLPKQADVPLLRDGDFLSQVILKIIRTKEVGLHYNIHDNNIHFRDCFSTKCVLLQNYWAQKLRLTGSYYLKRSQIRNTISYRLSNKK